jgi:hypothetical protein
MTAGAAATASVATADGVRAHVVVAFRVPSVPAAEAILGLGLRLRHMIRGLIRARAA